MAQMLSAPYNYFADANGAPLAGGFVYTYAAGTTTPQASYTDSSGSTPASNPVVLDSAGRASIWLSGSYKIVVKDSLGNTIHTDDNISALTTGGDMTKAVYDPANILEQLVGLTAVQTLTNKTIATKTPTTPKGRLTLASSVAVMITDATAQTSIYYTPYNGDDVAIYDGTNFINKLFSQLTLALNTSNHLSTNLYDVFVFLNNGVVTIAAGPAWTNSSTRSAAITQINGLWVNNATITLTNGSTSYAGIAANQATYVGTFYATANGQTGVAFNPSAASGGSNNIIGIWNAYNRVRAHANGSDSTSTWTYGSATVRSANNSALNRISWVDGLGQSYIEASYQILAANSAGGGGSQVGVGINSTTAITGFALTATGTANTLIYGTLTSYPVLGFNYIQALESVPGGATTETYNGGKTNMAYKLSTEY